MEAMSGRNRHCARCELLSNMQFKLMPCEAEMALLILLCHIPVSSSFGGIQTQWKHAGYGCGESYAKHLQASCGFLKVFWSIIFCTLEKCRHVMNCSGPNGFMWHEHQVPCCWQHSTFPVLFADYSLRWYCGTAPTLAMGMSQMGMTSRFGRLQYIILFLSHTVATIHDCGQWLWAIATTGRLSHHERFLQLQAILDVVPSLAKVISFLLSTRRNYTT